jgi:hypothetical protein
MKCLLFHIKKDEGSTDRDKCVPVTKALRVFRLRMEELLPIWTVLANIFNKKSRTTDKGWYLAWVWERC